MSSGAAIAEATSGDTLQQPCDVAPGTFESQAHEVLQRLRVTLARLIEAVPGPSSRPTDLERTLRLGTKLAWQVHRLAHAANPIAECDHVPGMAGIRQLLKAARRVSVPIDRIEAVNQAMESFESLVRRHAGDRLTFATMASSLVGAQELIDLKLRRSLFRENSRVWGVQVKTSLCASIFSPGSDEELVDSALIRGLREIRRLRANTPLRLSGARLRADHLGALDQCPLEGDGLSLAENTSILEPFCTKPLPRLISRSKGDHVETYLPPGPIGKVGAPTYYMASSRRGIPWRDGASPALELTSRTAVGKPCERLVLDVFIHDELLGGARPGVSGVEKRVWDGGSGESGAVECEAGVYGSLSDLGRTVAFSEMSEGERLPVAVDPVSWGRAAEAVHTPHVPEYPAMFEHVCERMGWDANRFVLHRWEYRYPILGSVIFTECRVPKLGKMK